MTTLRKILKRIQTIWIAPKLQALRSINKVGNYAYARIVDIKDFKLDDIDKYKTAYGAEATCFDCGRWECSCE